MKRTPSFKSTLFPALGLSALLLFCGGLSRWKTEGALASSPSHAKPFRSPVSTGSSVDVIADHAAVSESAGAKQGAGHDEIPNDLWQALNTARRTIRPKENDSEHASHHAHHPGQNLIARFGDRGILIRPAGESGWELAMTSKSAEEGSTISINGTRAEYLHPDGIMEWFENRADGIEHGFTLARRPVGDDGIALIVGLDGLTPEADGGSGDLLLCSADGKARLRYSGLKAWDAEGDPLPATMEVVGDDIQIAVNDHGATYPVTVDPLITRHRERIDMMSPALGDSHNQFGQALAFDGEIALVGVPHDNLAAGPHVGSVYVFKRNGGTWTQEAWLTASDAASWDLFGSAIAIGENTAFIGAPGAAAGGGINANRGQVYVFTRQDGVWTQQSVLLGSNGTFTAGFGAALAISGESLIVGAPEVTSGTLSSTPQFPGCAYVFDRSGHNWSQSAKLTPADGAAADSFGAAVALDGDRAVVGAPHDDASGGLMEGSVHLFERDNGSWSSAQTLRMAGPRNDAMFGAAIDLEGDTLLIGAPYDNGPGGTGLWEGGVFVFVESGGSWSLQTRLAPASDGVVGFGRALLLEGDQAIVGAPGREYVSPDPVGSVHFFHRDQGAWSAGDPLTPDNGFAGDTFGFPLVLGGQTLLAGMGSAGSYADYTINGVESIHVFHGSGGSWQPEALLRPTDGGDESYYGTAVALDGDRCVIGLPYDDSGVNDYRGGSAYILSRAAGAWTLESRLSHPNPRATAEFGLAAAIEGSLVVIGSEDGAFVYRRNDSGWELEESLKPSFRVTDDKFGGAVAISQGRIAVGAPFIPYRALGKHGKVFLFEKEGSGSDWRQIALLEANETYSGYHRGDLFGEALSFDGRRLLVGAPSRDGINFNGKAYTFVGENNVWSEEASFSGEGPSGPDRFGCAVALDGERLLIGASGINQAHVYRHETVGWELHQVLSSEEAGDESRFGSAVALGGPVALVGAPRFQPQYAGDSPATPGSAHFFEIETGIWKETLSLRGDATSSDAFGFSVALDGNSILIGAPWEDFLTSPTGNIAPDQGSAYFFEIGSGVSVFIGHFDTDADGALSPEEWRSVYATPPKKETSFAEIDSDQSGELDETEIRAAKDSKKTATTLGLWLDRAAAFIELDTDQNGHITRPEIGAMWAPRTSPRIIDWTWSRLESRGDLDFPGWIKARNLPSLSAFDAAKNLRSERRAIFRRLDGNEDNLVSRQEFPQLFGIASPSLIEAAWRKATQTPKKSPSPASITLTGFVEAPKLPRPAWE